MSSPRFHPAWLLAVPALAAIPLGSFLATAQSRAELTEGRNKEAEVKYKEVEGKLKAVQEELKVVNDKLSKAEAKVVQERGPQPDPVVDKLWSSKALAKEAHDHALEQCEQGKKRIQDAKEKSESAIKAVLDGQDRVVAAINAQKEAERQSAIGIIQHAPEDELARLKKAEGEKNDALIEERRKLDRAEAERREAAGAYYAQQRLQTELQNRVDFLGRIVQNDGP